MSERSRGKARPSLPRLGDLGAVPRTERDPSQGRDAQGRFLPGNPAATGRGWKQLIAKMAGRELQGETAELGQAAYRLHLALLAELPSDGPTVRSLVATQARSAILAARYASRATDLGLDTDAGMKAVELSIKLDARAERLAVTALDLSTKHAQAKRKGKPGDVHARVLEAFGESAAAGGNRG